MVTTTVREIQQDFLSYLHRAEQGETILVVQDDRPIAELRPMGPMLTEPRPYGLCAGQFVVPDDFDQPLPDDILSAFEGT
jgi:antitoxin (DNA-binding transcriptional repressor) of toxin-antitoxin stability system